MPVYLSGMARGLLGREHPLQMHHQRRQALREADCVVLAGAPCDFRLDYGRHVRRSSDADRRQPQRQGRARSIAAPISRRSATPARSSIVSPRASGGDGARRDDWIAALRARDRAREAEIDEQAQAAGEHVNPIALLRAVDRAAGDNAVFVADGGDFVATASYIVRPRGPRGWLDPGVFGTLGVGAGFALARRSVGRAPKCGFCSATAPAAGAWPSSTPSCATASR